MATREEMVEAIIDSIESWDYEELLDWVQGERRSYLDMMNDDEVAEEYGHIANE